MKAAVLFEEKIKAMTCATDGYNPFSAAPAGDLPEALRKMQATLEDGISQLNDQMKAMGRQFDTKLADVNTRLEGVERRLEGVERKIGQLTTRVDAVERTVATLTTSVEDLKGKVEGHHRSFRKVRMS